MKTMNKHKIGNPIQSLTGLFLLTLVFLPPVGAQSMEDQGWSAEKISGSGDFIRWNVTDSEGFTFTYSGTALPEDEALQSLEEMLSLAKDLQHFKVSGVSLLQQQDRLEMIVQTESAQWQGISLQEYLPTGLLFFKEDNIDYSFRIFVDGYLLRLQGGYFAEEDLLDKLVRAIQNPEEFVRSQNPEYFSRVVGEIDAELQSTVKLTEEIREQSARLTQATKELKEQQEKLLQAVHVLNNTGLFGSLRDYNAQAVDQIILWKKENPGLTMAETKEKLKDAGITASSKEVLLTFALFFNQFED